MSARKTVEALGIFVRDAVISEEVYCLFGKIYEFFLEFMPKKSVQQHKPSGGHAL